LSERSAQSEWWREPRAYTAALTGVLVFAAALRLYSLGRFELWLDEIHSLLNSAAHRARFEALPEGVVLGEAWALDRLGEDSTPAAVWRDLRADTHPPLYFMVLNGWRRVAGDGEVALRLPALLFSVLSLVPLALAFRVSGRPGVGILAALLLALCHAHIEMGQQARQYSLALLWTTTCLWFTARIVNRPSNSAPRGLVRDCVLLGACMLGAVLTHYFAALPLAGLGLYVVCAARGTARVGWLAAAVAAGSAFAVLWGPSLVAQSTFIRAQDWLTDPADDHVRRTVLRAATLPARLMFFREMAAWGGSWIWFESILGVAIVAAAVIGVIRRRAAEAWAPTAWYVVCVAVLVVLDLATGKELLTHSRYGVIALPGLIGLLAGAIGRLSRRWIGVCATLLGLAFFFTLELPATQNPSTRKLIAALRTGAPSARDVLVFDGTNWVGRWGWNNYLVVMHYLQPPPCDVMVINATPGAEVRSALAGYDSIFVVRPGGDPPENWTPATHRPGGRSAQVAGIGFLYRFVRGP
jgi:uncharacterized membrane protein